MLCCVKRVAGGFADSWLADDIPGVADFASDLDDEYDEEDDEDDDDDDDDAGSEDDADSGPASKPPPASKKGKGAVVPKSVPKLPPRKGRCHMHPSPPPAPPLSLPTPSLFNARVQSLLFLRRRQNEGGDRIRD